MIRHGTRKHPDDRVLHRLFDGALGDAERAAVQAHVERCARCGARRDEAGRLSSAVRAEPVPAYASDALARVLARRDAGERGMPEPWNPTTEDRSDVDLPEASLTTVRPRWHRFVSGGLVAALLLTMVLARLDASAERAASIHGAGPCATLHANPEDTMPAHSVRRFVAALYGIPLAWVGACATDVPVGPPITASQIDGTRLRPMTLEYGTTHWVDDLAPSHAPGSLRLELRPATWQSRPAWVVVNHLAPNRMTREGPTADSLFVDRRDLGILGAVRNAPRTSYRVHRDSGYVRFRIANDVRVREWEDPIEPAVRARNPLFLPVAFAALPLDEGWRATVETMDIRAAWSSYTGRRRANGERTVGRSTTALQVVGRERITVPAGTFDAWRLRAQTRHEVTGLPAVREAPELMWVSRKEGVLLRIKRTRAEGDTRYTTVVELTKIDRP